MPSSTQQYGVVLDAGSSGTRAYVYRWENLHSPVDGPSGKNLPFIESNPSWTMKINPGISAFNNRISDIEPIHLRPLLNHVKSVVKRNNEGSTPIYFLATAGMRLLPKSDQDRILTEVCRILRTTTKFFLPDCHTHVTVIPGETEGLYGWVATNYLLDRLGVNSSSPTLNSDSQDNLMQTYGFLEMGGASAQIAYAPNATESAKNPERLTKVRFRTLNGHSTTYSLFTQSWLGFGANEARKRYISTITNGTRLNTQVRDACLFKDLRVDANDKVISHPNKLQPNSKQDTPVPSLLHTLVGVGLFDECLLQAQNLLMSDLRCASKPCLFDYSTMPATDFRRQHFVGVSEFWHSTHDVFNLDKFENGYDYAQYQALAREFCGFSWDRVSQGAQSNEWGRSVDEKKLIMICFKAAWLMSVLKHGLGMQLSESENVDGPVTPKMNQISMKDVLQNRRVRERLKFDKYNVPSVPTHPANQSFHAINKVRGVEANWSLGKILFVASSQIPIATNLDPMKEIVGFSKLHPADLPLEKRPTSLANFEETNSSGGRLLPGLTNSNGHYNETLPLKSSGKTSINQNIFIIFISLLSVSVLCVILFVIVRRVIQQLRRQRRKRHRFSGTGQIRPVIPMDQKEQRSLKPFRSLHLLSRGFAEQNVKRKSQNVQQSELMSERVYNGMYDDEVNTGKESGESSITIDVSGMSERVDLTTRYETQGGRRR